MGESISPAVQSAINRILQQEYICDSGEKPIIAKGETIFSCNFRVQLPSRSEDVGESETGVKALEPVYFFFPPDYPRRPPRIRLRSDFNRYLPHLNPGKEGELVYPCIYEGRVSELFHQKNGIEALLDQMCDWLDKAASNSLIDKRQGWEPTRRDDLFGEFVSDLEQVRSQISYKGNGYKMFHSKIHSLSDEDWFFSMLRGFDKFSEKNLDGIVNDNENFGVLFWGEKTVCHYLPETVYNLKTLYESAKLCDAEKALNECVSAIEKLLAKRVEDKEWTFLVTFVHLIRRPINIIGSKSNSEIISYVAKLQYENSKICLDSKVYPVHSVLHSNSDLMRDLSGFDIGKSKQIIQIGCGSLGSKVAMHLARLGVHQIIAFDNGYFMPHNNARHALSSLMSTSKAELLRNALHNIEIKHEVHKVDILDKLDNHTFYPKSIIIDSTASFSVYNALCDHKGKIGRIVRTTLLGNGDCALLLIEGALRSVRIDDMMCKAYDDCLENEKLHSFFFNKSSDVVSVGEGCSSRTMVMSDANISVFAASMANRAQKLIEDDPPVEGEMNLGIIQNDGMSLQWERILIDSTILVTNQVSNDWEIRILPAANNQMMKEAIKYEQNETGGVLIGHISIHRRCITVTRVLTPRKCYRSPNRFDFETDSDLTGLCSEISKKTRYELVPLGTWHSHPMGGNASGVDRVTFEKMKELNGITPATLLIWTPNGYFGYVDTQESNYGS